MKSQKIVSIVALLFILIWTSTFFYKSHLIGFIGKYEIDLSMGDGNISFASTNHQGQPLGTFSLSPMIESFRKSRDPFIGESPTIKSALIGQRISHHRTDSHYGTVSRNTNIPFWMVAIFGTATLAILVTQVQQYGVDQAATHLQLCITLISIINRESYAHSQRLASLDVKKMIARSRLAFNEEYYAQYYSDWMRTRSKFRKFAVPFGVLIIAAGLVLVTQTETHRYLGIAIIGFGVLQLVDALTYRSRWVNKRLKAGGSSAGEFEFYDDRIHIRSDSSEGHFLLSGIIESIASDNGIFLIPQKGLSFYIPWESISPAEAMPRVRSLLTKTGDGADQPASRPTVTNK